MICSFKNIPLAAWRRTDCWEAGGGQQQEARGGGWRAAGTWLVAMEIKEATGFRKCFGGKADGWTWGRGRREWSPR